MSRLAIVVIAVVVLHMSDHDFVLAVVVVKKNPLLQINKINNDNS